MITNLPESSALISFLRNLFDTNDEFASSYNNEFFAKFQDGQSPTLTILKCSDSRVQMESFDKTPQNGVFAIRNIGNQLITSEGSVDFGVMVLKTPFLLIIGHSDCGAVSAALNKVIAPSRAINKELRTIKIDTDKLNDAIIDNINNQVQLALKKYKGLVALGRLTVIGALYDFKNDYGFGHGRVVLTNINGIMDYDMMRKEYSELIPNLHFWNKNN